MKQQRWDTGGRWQETDLVSGWTVREDLVVQGGHRVVVRLTIRPTTGGTVPIGGITARLLRLVKVGKLGEGNRLKVAQYFGVDVANRLYDHLGWSSGRRRRRRPHASRPDDRFYAELARDYVTLRREVTTRPTAALATMRGVSPERMRSHIHLARVNGFLTETSRGRSGGELTPKARRELAPKKTV